VVQQHQQLQENVAGIQQQQQQQQQTATPQLVTCLWPQGRQQVAQHGEGQGPPQEAAASTMPAAAHGYDDVDNEYAYDEPVHCGAVVAHDESSAEMAGASSSWQPSQQQQQQQAVDLQPQQPQQQAAGVVVLQQQLAAAHAAMAELQQQLQGALQQIEQQR
jgi:hypothetical protein